MTYITSEHIRVCYDLSIRKRNKEIGIAEAKRIAVQKVGIAEASAQDLIYNTEKLLDNKSYTRTMSVIATESILKWINDDFGVEIALKAAETILNHVQYYSQLEHGGFQREIQRIAANYILENEKMVSSDELILKQIEFGEQLARSSKDNNSARLERLKRANAKPKSYLAVQRFFIRNPDVVVERLKHANGICEGCLMKAPFVKKSNKEPYLEVHHKTPLSEGGHDTVENTVALCPNCHREAHFGIEWKKYRS